MTRFYHYVSKTGKMGYRFPGRATRNPDRFMLFTRRGKEEMERSNTPPYGATFEGKWIPAKKGGKYHA